MFQASNQEEMLFTFFLGSPGEVKATLLSVPSSERKVRVNWLREFLLSYSALSSNMDSGGRQPLGVGYKIVVLPGSACIRELSWLDAFVDVVGTDGLTKSAPN